MVFLNGVLLRIPVVLCATLFLRIRRVTLVLISGIISLISVQVRNTEFLTMNLNACFLVHLVLQVLKSSLSQTGSLQRTSTVSSMLMVTSLRISFISVRIYLYRNISTVLLIRLSSISKYQDIFLKIS